MPMHTADTILALVDKSGGECWPWKGGIDRDGYGRVRYRRRTRSAHAVVYEIAVGPVPAGLQLDHRCRNRSCVNPGHLEPVTQRVNTLRGAGPAAINAAKSHCKRGHAFDAENTYAWRGNRICRACRRMHDNNRSH